MLRRLRSWYASCKNAHPSQRLDVLDSVLLALFASATLYGLVMVACWAVHHQTWAIWAAIVGFGGQLFISLAYWLARHGHRYAASVIPVVALFAGVTSLVVGQEPGEFTGIGYAVATLVAGILLGIVPAIVCALASIPAYLIAAMIPGVRTPGSFAPAILALVRNGAGMAIGQMIVVVFVWMHYRDLCQALGREHSLAGELQASKADLELRVANRTAELLEANQKLQQDNAERRRSEQALREMQLLTERIMATAPNVIYLYDVQEHSLAYVSPGVERVLGYSAEQARESGEQTIASLVHADDLTALRAHMARCTTSVEGQVLETEFRARHRNGGWVVVHSRDLVFVRTADGQAKLILGTAEDITARKAAEEALRRKSEHQEQLLRSARHLTASLDLGEVLTRIAQEAKENLEAHGCAIYRIEEDGQTLTPLVAIEPPYEAEIMSTPLAIDASFTGQAVMAKRGLVFNDAAAQNRGQHIPGTPVEEDERVIVVPFLADDQVVGAMCLNRHGLVFTDDDLALAEAFAAYAGSALKNARLYQNLQQEMVERSRLENQLVEAQKLEAVGRLAGGVAHEFNNLLTIINGYSDIALGGLGPAHPVSADVGEIRKAGVRAADLTRQLLAFGRRQMLRMEALSLNDVLTNCRAMLGHVLGPAISVKMTLTENLDPVRADLTQLEQVILNLAANARDAMPVGGMLTLETSEVLVADDAAAHADISPGRYARLAIRDTGQGMSAEVLEHLFEPFFTTKEVGHGTGLGLASVHGIIRQLKGSIDVWSKPGQGSVFRIHLPLYADRAPSVARDAGRPGLAGGVETIMVVEDDVAVRQTAVLLLRRLGYGVIEAADAPTAIALARERGSAISLVLTDVAMPDMSGPQLARTLREMYPEMRILYMSGYTEEAIGESPADRRPQLLQKPFSLEQLALHVRQALDA